MYPRTAKRVWTEDEIDRLRSLATQRIGLGANCKSARPFTRIGQAKGFLVGPFTGNQYHGRL